MTKHSTSTIHIPNFIPNEPDGEHCLQSCYRMVVETLTGEAVSREAAEAQTGYVPGRDSWQFAMIRSLAKRGLATEDCEDFDPQEFVDDTEACVIKQVGDKEIAKSILEETNIELETAIVQECLEHPLVKFCQRVPNFADLQEELEDGALLICNVNSRRLNGERGHRGHFVLVTKIAEDTITVTNPGPPASYEQVYPRSAFEAAWASPSDSMRNYISVRRGE